MATGTPCSQNVKRNHRGYRVGASHHRSKLSDDDVRLMRELREKHRLPYSQIAEKFECSLWTVRDIVTYVTR